MYRIFLVATLLIAGIAGSLSAASAAPVASGFLPTWQRTDLPVANGQANRTWMWGPEANTQVIQEQYAEAPGGQRQVQYFDKSRMEITNPAGDPSSIWYVTNGLLVVEMMSGDMQVGHNEWVNRSPADVTVAGDADDDWGPTYETIAWNIEDGHTYEDGQLIYNVIDWLGYDPDMSSEMVIELGAYGVTAGPYSPATGKHTASIFWDFMTSNALVYQNGSNVTAPLFQDPYYATGLPVDQAWWAEVKVGGTYKWVLLQCFERRCLTYTPDNPAGWQVEAGNVGQHYYSWRYDSTSGPVNPPPPPPPTPSEPPPPPPPPGNDNAPSEGDVLYNTSISQWRSDQDGWGNRGYRSGNEYHLNLQPLNAFFTFAPAGSATFGDASYSVDVRRPSAFGVAAGCMSVRANHRSTLDLCLTFEDQSTVGFTALFYENVGSTDFREEILLTGLIDAGAPSEFHTLKMISRGQRIWVFVDNEYMGTVRYDGGTIHDGVIGVGAYNFEPNLNVTLAFRNFVVRAIN